MIFALLLLIPAAIALVTGEGFYKFLMPVPFLILLGSMQFMLFGESRNFRTVNGLLLVACVWFLMFFICMLPYLSSGMTPLDALFESVSGITTTGLSVMVDVESADISLLTWRALTMWVGGIIVILSFMYLLPMCGIGRSIMYNELSGSGSSNYTLKMKNAAQYFLFTYGILSLINFILLLVCGMAVFDAFCLMCTTISTCGLMITNDSLMSYTLPVQLVTILFMFLGGTNFYLHFRAVYKREKRVYLGNSEFRIMALWFLAVSVVIYLMISYNGLLEGTMSLEQHLTTFKNALFTTVSLGTTSGLYVDDFTLYPGQCTALLMVVAFIGASSGSTSGGVKFGRLRIVAEYMRNGFDQMVHPNAVYDVKIDGSSVDDETVRSALTLVLLYISTLIVGAVAFMIYGMDMLDAFGLTISGLANGGMGFGHFGPTGNFADLAEPMKMILIILMWLGRLEILTALVLVTPGFWREIVLDRRARRIKRRSLMSYVRKD